MAFGTSYQNVGLNRYGAWMETVPDKADAKREIESEIPAHEKPNEIWRRKFDLFDGQPQEKRTANLARLVKWIEQKAAGHQTMAGHPRMVGQTFLSAGWAHGLQSSAPPPTESTVVTGESLGDLGAPSQQTGMSAPPSQQSSAPLSRASRVSFISDAPDFSDWARVRHAAPSLEALCREINISRGELTRLTREFCNLTPGEIIDGVRLRGFKHEIYLALRSAARELWGEPGNLARALAVEGALAKPRSLLNADVNEHDFNTEARRTRSSRRTALGRNYFGAQQPTWDELRGDEGSRTEELIEKLWKSRDIGEIAVRLGFASAAHLKGACLTVYGKALKNIERDYASDLVDFYLCAEEKMLRDLASREGESAISCRARYLYCGDDLERPEPPFLDRWSAAEFSRGNWLSAMADAFG